MFLTIYTFTVYLNFSLFFFNLLTEGLLKTLKCKCSRTQKEDNIAKTVNPFGKP